MKYIIFDSINFNQHLKAMYQRLTYDEILNKRENNFYQHFFPYFSFISLSLRLTVHMNPFNLTLSHQPT